MISIRKAVSGDDSAWDRFVNTHPSGRYCYLSGYARAVESVYGMRTSRVLALSGSKIVGVLPVWKAGVPVWGKGISIPFSQYGGPLTEPGLSDPEGVFQALVGRAADELRTSTVTMEGVTPPFDPEGGKKLTWWTRYENAVLSLSHTEEALFNTVVRASVRKSVRKAQRAGVSVVSDAGEELLRSFFYPRYVAAMKGFGTPPHPLKFFMALKKQMPGNFRIFYAFASGKPVAALMGIASKKIVNILFIVSDKGTLEHRPNDILHWEFICWALNNGHELFDFGVMRYQGQRFFKTKWGVDISPYRFCRYGGSAPPEGRSEAEPGVLAKAWKRCVPYRVTPYLGQYVRRIYGK